MNEVDVANEIWVVKDLISEAQEEMTYDTEQADIDLSSAIELLDEASQTL